MASDCFKLWASFRLWRKHQTRYLQSSFTWIYWSAFKLMFLFPITMHTPQSIQCVGTANTVAAAAIIADVSPQRSSWDCKWNRNRLPFTFKCCIVSFARQITENVPLHLRHCNVKSRVLFKDFVAFSYIVLCICYCFVYVIDSIVGRRRSFIHSFRIIHSLGNNLLSELFSCIFSLSYFLFWQLNAKSTKPIDQD